VAARRERDPETQRSRRPPATTPEDRENQVVALAIDLAENQIREGTASAQVITHFLKLGSTRERLEQERIRAENKLVEAKVQQIGSSANTEQLYKEALSAMRAYSGQPEPEEEEDDDY
jgi:hypothetical protein